MDNSIYEVERDEYAGFIGQLNKEMMNIEQFYQDETTFIKIKSKNTGTHLCTRIIPENDKEHYFIFNMPEDNERVAPKPVLKITLNTKEEVQSFVDALNKIQLEAHKNDGDI